ncbi:putative Molybdate transporter 1 [Cocos nucifera]|uniref:Putative Molybdate transporter 1 n=1 Tax=Cocos nucifera TaxID=13894 RepID=A0A8K0ITH8_COCNU|nr:putative Molybdate transporter 1 [Cocos nucifera]
MKTTVWAELGGSVGDLGTYIPIVLALCLVNGLDLGTTLVFTAIYNAATGLLFGIPMPVQPMKSIAAVAIAESTPLSIPLIMAAGLSTAAVLFLLGAAGLMSFLYRFIPVPVVRGVQLSQGLSFAFSAIKYIRYEQDFAAAKSGDPRPWLGLDGLLLALCVLLFVILVTGSGGDDEDRDRQRRIPA